MPVHPAGKGCYQWGHHGHIYCGPGAYQKAERQGRAAYSHGYKGKEMKTKENAGQGMHIGWMDAYVYAADLYCEDCGRALQEKLPEDTGDSNDYPQGLYPDGGGEADSLQHCGAGDKCLNAMTFTGTKIGVWLGNPLTTDGVEYLKEMLANPNANAYQRALHEFWSEVYADYLEGSESVGVRESSARSKFKNGDRVKFTFSGPNFDKPGTVEYVRPDGLLIIHFDNDPPESILVVQPHEVAHATRKMQQTVRRTVRDPRVSRGPNTPGYNTRLFIAFTTDRTGKPLAYYWSGHGAPGTLGRWIRMPLDQARDHIAQGNADQSPYMPPMGAREVDEQSVRDYEGMSFEQWLATARAHSTGIRDDSVARRAFAHGVDPLEFVELYGGFALEEGRGSVNFQQGERLRIRSKSPQGHTLEAFWYTLPYAMTLDEVALQFAQTGQPGMLLEIVSGKLKWTFRQERHAGQPSVERVRGVPGR